MAAKKKCPEFENHERWLVSFADMMTLLFAVFVVLYALNMSKPSSQVEQAQGSIHESFNTPLEEIPPEQRAGPTEQGFGIFQNMRGNQARQPLLLKYPNAQMPVKVIDAEMTKVRVALEDRLYGPNRFRDKSKPGQERVVSIERTPQGFKVQLLARHFFDSGSFRVKKEALKEMDEVAGVLKELGRPITIEGHTDNIPSRGEFSNWELSTLRATSVLRYLVTEHGFPASTLSAAGYADQRPIHHNGTEAGRALNRRIEIHVNYQPDALPDPQ